MFLSGFRGSYRVPTAALVTGVLQVSAEGEKGCIKLIFFMIQGHKDLSATAVH